MKFAVIAANGRTGQEFVKQALEHGHTINAGVHGNHDFKENKNLNVIPCDATNVNDIEKLIKSCDAVASFIGHGKNSPPLVQTEAIKNAIGSCQKVGIKRIISLTGTGVRYPDDHITLMDRFLNLSIGIIDPKRVNDGKRHVKVLEESSLDYTVIRVLKLTNNSPTPFSLSAHGPVKSFTSRSEVAEAALQVLEDESFIRQAPIVSKP